MDSFLRNLIAHHLHVAYNSILRAINTTWRQGIAPQRQESFYNTLKAGLFKKDRLIAARAPSLRPDDTNGEFDFYTHDYGGRPFHVIYRQHQIDVYKINSPEWDDPDWQERTSEPENYNTLIWSTKNVLHIWVGRHSLHEEQGMRNCNSVLIQITSTTYVYICKDICEFQIPDTVLDFDAPIFGSDVVYAAVLTFNHTYLLDESARVSNDELISKNHFTKPYRAYYDHKLHQTDPFIGFVIQKRIMGPSRGHIRGYL